MEVSFYVLIDFINTFHERKVIRIKSPVYARQGLNLFSTILRNSDSFNAINLSNVAFY